MKRFRFWLLLFVAALALPACGTTGGEDPAEEETDGSVLTFAILNPLENRTKFLVDSFNSSHEDVQIEVWDYSDENGVQRLLLDLVAGIVPDVMELQQLGEIEIYRKCGDHVTPTIASNYGIDGHYLPYQQLVRKGYLEDLWPYIENDPDYGREGVVEQPLKAAEMNGGLYMLFGEFYISTLIAPQRMVGGQMGWTFDEFMEVFESMPPGSTPLQYTANQHDVFFHLFSMTLNQFVDWDTGKVSFDNDEFFNILTFVKTFPAEFETGLTDIAVIRDIIDRVLGGYQLLQPVTIGHLFEVSNLDMFFTEPVTFIGYPTEAGGTGSCFTARGPKLAMSSVCENKDAAWEFMRPIIAQRYGRRNMKVAQQYEKVLLPINRKDYDLANEVSMSGAVEEKYWFNWEVRSISWKDDIQTEPPTENDLRRLEELIANTNSFYWPDDELANIVWESIGPYLAGDKTMDDVIRLIENRVKLYVGEQM